MIDCLELEQLRTGVFRTNPALAALPVNRLPPALQAAAAGQAGSFGVLVGRNSGNWHAEPLDKETALVLLALQQPGALPDFALAELLDRDGAWLRRLLLEHRIELRLDGTFIGGGELAHRLYPMDRIEVPALATRAIDHALSLYVDDFETLVMMLYRYNTAPITPRWRRTLGDAARIPSFLTRGGKVAFERLMRGWEIAGKDEHWLHVRRRHHGPSGTKTGCKLYVSPRTAALPEIMPAVLKVLAEGGAFAFKIGNSLADLMRPDKVVAYFDHRDRLQQVADRLCSSLQGCPVQGVPFSAPIDQAGLLGWGVDPEGGGVSWRFCVCRSLAEGLLRARTSGVADPAAFALRRLSDQDIDPATFRPGPGWRGTAS